MDRKAIVCQVSGFNAGVGRVVCVLGCGCRGEVYKTYVKLVHKFAFGLAQKVKVRIFQPPAIMRVVRLAGLEKPCFVIA